MRAVYDITLRWNAHWKNADPFSIVADDITDAARKAQSVVQERANRNDFGWRVVKIEEVRRVVDGD